MTKVVDTKNQVWHEQNGELIRIGFTKEFIDTFDECWHILPANMEKYTKNAPLLCIEHNDCLISVMAPMSGNFLEMSDKARNFPDKLVETDVVMQLTTRVLTAPQDLPGRLANTAQAGLWDHRNIEAALNELRTPPQDPTPRREPQRNQDVAAFERLVTTPAGLRPVQF